MGTEVKTEDLEKQLESMLDIEKFPPPDEFRKHALVTDESLYEEAAQDLEGFWSRQADQLIDWIDKPSQTLDESNAPFYRWFADGTLNVSANCLDRHIDAGKGEPNLRSLLMREVLRAGGLELAGDGDGAMRLRFQPVP